MLKVQCPNFGCMDEYLYHCPRYRATESGLRQRRDELQCTLPFFWGGNPEHYLGQQFRQQQVSIREFFRNHFWFHRYSAFSYING